MPYIDTVDIQGDQRPFEVVMRQLKGDEVVTGMVEDYASCPVADAVVSVWPDPFRSAIDDPLLALTAHIVTTRTDSTGAFRIEAPADQGLRASVFHKLYGLSPVFALPPGVRVLRVRMPRVGSILLQVHQNAGGIARSGRLQVMAVHTSRDKCFREYGIPPLELTEYPVGRYLLFARTLGGVDYGVALCDVEQGVQRNCVVQMFPATTIKGMVCDGDGHPVEGAEVAFRLPDWPDEVVRVMATVHSTPDGTFEVFAGDGVPGRLIATKGRLSGEAGAYGGENSVALTLH